MVKNIKKNLSALLNAKNTNQYEKKKIHFIKL